MKKCLLITLLFFSVTSYADNYGFLRDAPASFFTDQDYQLYKKTLNNVLVNSRDNVKTQWHNPKTGASGYFMPLKTERKNGLACRRVQSYSQAQGRTGMMTETFCKANGEWQISN